DQVAAGLLEGREGSEHAQHHHRQRHQGEGRGVGQRGGGLQQAVVEEAFPQEARERDRTGAVTHPFSPPSTRPALAHPRKPTRWAVAAASPILVALQPTESPLADILVLYYSRGGSVARLARQIARGVEEVPGMQARLRTVPPVAAVTQQAAPPVPEDG